MKAACPGPEASDRAAIRARLFAAFRAAGRSALPGPGSLDDLASDVLDDPLSDAPFHRDRVVASGGFRTAYCQPTLIVPRTPCSGSTIVVVAVLASQFQRSRRLPSSETASGRRWPWMRNSYERART